MKFDLSLKKIPLTDSACRNIFSGVIWATDLQIELFEKDRILFNIVRKTALFQVRKVLATF